MELVVAMTYAKGLFDAATDQNAVDEIREDVVALDNILEEEQDFCALLRDPGLSRERKKDMVRGVLEGRVHTSVLNFLYILIDKGRFYGYHTMAKQFCKLVDEARGIGDGEIISASPLDDAQREKFEAECGKLLQKKISLINTVDPSLIGGVKILIDGKVIDASFSSKLAEMAKRIKNS